MLLTLDQLGHLYLGERVVVVASQKQCKIIAFFLSIQKKGILLKWPSLQKTILQNRNALKSV